MTPLPNNSPEPSAATSIRTEDHVVWNEGPTHVIDRIELRFVAESWILCVLASLALTTVASAIFLATSSADLTASARGELGVLAILSAMGTFIGFAATMAWRLVRVAHDRLSNSLAVAALQVVVTLLVFGVQLATNDSFAGTGGDWFSDLSLSLNGSLVMAIVGCALAAGMVPASGDRPTGTQTEVTSSDRSL